MQAFLIPLIVFAILETDKSGDCLKVCLFHHLNQLVEVVILKIRQRNLLSVQWETSDQTEPEDLSGIWGLIVNIM